VLLLIGCATEVPRPATVEHRGAAGGAEGLSRAGKEWRPEVYVVQKGDTLYGIAFNYGFGYRELAELNGIQNPDAIFVGQKIRLFPKKTGMAGTPDRAESKPVEFAPKEQPKLVKFAYSEAAMALIDKVQQEESSTAAANNLAQPVSAIKEKQPDRNVGNPDAEAEEPAMDWSMPAQGKVIAQFSESANRKGIDIAGKLGQPVLASAAGKVVYSGSGLRGYGKLIIIKHNVTYLSAYAHNDKILVKEGQVVTRGQKIALMGSTDAEQVKLHFEIRRLGKPVDPSKFLALGKS
jgi:lipoprotein NlpD